MNTMLALSRLKRIWVCGVIACGALVGSPLHAQTPVPRIAAEIATAKQAMLKGSLHPLARPEFDAGRVPADTRLKGISLAFNLSAAQQADLNALIAEQLNPASPLFHQWLTPEQYGARFGMAQADLDKATAWLQQQGFTVDSVARGRNLLRFSGSVAQVERAFATQIHYYAVGGARHFSPATELSLPAALASVVMEVRNLNDFRPRSQVVVNKFLRPRADFTSNASGNVFLAPGDIVTAYDVKPLYTAGNRGAGQAIAVVGQSAIDVKDIENFQLAAAPGSPVKDPTLVLMPNTGASTLYSGDETESDLDLEWAGAMAPEATLYLVYVGGSPNYSAFDALQYAIDQQIAPIISVSYGECEPELGGYSLETAFQQAATQGQTIISASGDSGSTACFVSTTVTSPSLSIQQEVAVNYPASSPWVTGVGGTEITAAHLTAGSGYWTAANGADVLSSATGYIPEVTWNDDTPNCGSSNCLSASGGGASALFPKPLWQTGVTGIPADNKRDLPDIALYSSPGYPGYLYCTSDNSSWASRQDASCGSGFRDSTSNTLLTVAGGTSFAAPIFSGMLALLNQQLGYTTGQGLINPALYTLAANNAHYASAFHDITLGNNDCTAGGAYCLGTSGFSAWPGYDQVTGLGSVDLSNLANVWAANGAALIGTTTTLTAPATVPAVNVSGDYVVAVASNTGGSVPTGAVSLVVDNGTPITGNTLVNGSFTYSKAFATVGAHQIVAVYSGDATHGTSTGVLSVSIPSSSGGTGSFTLSSSPATLTVAQGNYVTETVTVTPASGYKGVVLLTFAVSGTSGSPSLCYDFTNLSPNGNGTVSIPANSGPVATLLTVDTNPSDCGAAIPHTGGGNARHSLHRLRAAGNTEPGSKQQPGSNHTPAALALAGLLLAGFFGRGSRRFRTLAGMVVLLAAGLAVSACGSGGGGAPPASGGTYTVTITGHDSVSATITGQTSFTLNIH